MPIDHIIYAAPSLESGMDKIEALLGIRPVNGGQHPGLGTHNALLALGPGCYLEVIAPDPKQPTVERPLWIPVDTVEKPRLIYWAAKADELKKLVQEARSQGVNLGWVSEGSRLRPDGQHLRWRLTDPRANPADGVVPFFIDWMGTSHPAESLPKGGELISLKAWHPEAERVREQLKVLGLDLEVEQGNEPRLEARIKKTKGEVVVLE